MGDTNISFSGTVNTFHGSVLQPADIDDGIQVTLNAPDTPFTTDYEFVFSDATGEKRIKVPIVPAGFTVVRYLGRGTYGHVVAVRHEGSGSEYAMKVCPIDLCTLREVHALHHFRKLQRDWEHGRLIKNVVSLRLLFLPPRPGPNLVCVFVDLLNTTADEVVRPDRKPVSVLPRRSIMETLLNALHVTHMCGFVHRDLKPANVLLSTTWTAWLADFGSSRSSFWDGGGDKFVTNMQLRCSSGHLPVECLYDSAPEAPGSPSTSLGSPSLSVILESGVEGLWQQEYFSTGIILAEVILQEPSFLLVSQEAELDHIRNALHPDKLQRLRVPHLLALFNALGMKPPVGRNDDAVADALARHRDGEALDTDEELLQPFLVKKFPRVSSPLGKAVLEGPRLHYLAAILKLLGRPTMEDVAEMGRHRGQRARAMLAALDVLYSPDPSQEVVKFDPKGSLRGRLLAALTRDDPVAELAKKQALVDAGKLTADRFDRHRRLLTPTVAEEVDAIMGLLAHNPAQRVRPAAILASLFAVPANDLLPALPEHDHPPETPTISSPHECFVALRSVVHDIVHNSSILEEAKTLHDSLSQHVNTQP